MLGLNPFRLNATEVANLSQDELNRLVNSLIWNRARRLRVPIGQVLTTERINDPDGGVDALVDLGTATDEFLGERLVVWQFKRRWPKSAVLKQELRKPAVQQGFRRGASYLLVVGEDMVATRHGDRKIVLKRLADDAGCDGSVELYAATHIAGWTSSDPASLLALRSSIQGYVRVDRALQDPRHRGRFEFDQARRDILNDLSTRLFGPAPSDYVARIQGLPGVGKTRMGLEIANQLGLAALALYSPQVPPSQPDLFNWVAADEQVEVIVLIDECEQALAEHLEERARWCGGRLRLITIGPGQTKGPTAYALEPLDIEAMERVVRDATLTLTPDRVRWVAEVARGYVKLATVVARAIERGVSDVTAMSTD